jgi:cytochrome c oxidase subunit 2
MRAFQLQLALANIFPTFDPQSPYARAILDMGIVMLIVCAIIFVIVSGLIGYALVRGRQRGEGEPEQFAGSEKVEIVWTVIPLLIVAMLFGLTARAMQLSDPPAAKEPDLIVIGHQWWWEIRYPKSGAVTANEIHIPIGKSLSVRLDSTDVLHEFWAPQLTRKMTTVPNAGKHIWLRADKPGTYLGVCSEYCGTQHAWMRFLVVAEPEQEFEKWQAAQLAPAPVPTSGLAAQGAQLFKDLTCVNCHAIGGTAATARVAPDLTHFSSRMQLGAGVVPNTRDNQWRWMKNPQSVKPGVKMPDFKLSDEQTTQIVDYLQTLK